MSPKDRKNEEFRALYAKYQGWVFGLAYVHLRNREDALDASQEVFVRVYKALDSFRGDSSEKTWIYRITINVCVNQRRPKIRTLFHEPAQERKEELDAQDPDPDPLTALIHSEQSEAIEKILVAIPGNVGKVGVMFYLHRVPQKEIARELEIPPDTVAVYALRAKRRVISELGEWGGAENS
jgi:RNA polymerase sigma-70 factor, ECF subfamily